MALETTQTRDTTVHAKGGGGGGGGELPIANYRARPRLKGVPFSGCKRVGISRVGVYKRVGKTVI